MTEASFADSQHVCPAWHNTNVRVNKKKDIYGKKTRKNRSGVVNVLSCTAEQICPLKARRASSHQTESTHPQNLQMPERDINN